MKKAVTVFLALAFVVSILSSCSLEPQHSIRIKNSYSKTLNNVKINSTYLGTLEPGASTDYKPVNEGTFAFSGTVNGLAFTGGGSATGKGKHKWTVTINQSFQIVCEENK